MNSFIFRLNKDGSPITQGHGLLREMYFKPNRLEKEGGLDPIFRGSVAYPAQAIDVLMVDETRNSLFKTSAATPGKKNGFDLASINIQRGRDHGLPDLNTVRKNLGLKGKLIIRDPSVLRLKLTVQKCIIKTEISPTTILCKNIGTNEKY